MTLNRLNVAVDTRPDGVLVFGLKQTIQALVLSTTKHCIHGIAAIVGLCAVPQIVVGNAEKERSAECQKGRVLRSSNKLVERHASRVGCSSRAILHSRFIDYPLAMQSEPLSRVRRGAIVMAAYTKAGEPTDTKQCVHSRATLDVRATSADQSRPGRPAIYHSAQAKGGSTRTDSRFCAATVRIVWTSGSFSAAQRSVGRCIMWVACCMLHAGIFLRFTLQAPEIP